nr:uncharacterized protein LOC121129815 isoform X2 [Lepeophtheirus salmonis]
MVTRSWSLLLLLSLLKVANSVSNSNDEIYILKSEVNTLRAELEAFKLESERPNNLLENEEVLLHWLKRNVMDIRKDLIDEERQRGEDSRRSLGVEERMKGKMERGLEELRARVTEMQLEQETLRSLGEEIKSNIHFYNRIQSSDNSIMDPNIIHIRTKKQMSREFKKMYGRINEFFRRISEVEMSQATLKKERYLSIERKTLGKRGCLSYQNHCRNLFIIEVISLFINLYANYKTRVILAIFLSKLIV